jgi:hypothetical protein
MKSIRRWLRRRRDEKEPDLRPRLGLHDTRNAEEMSSYVGTPPMPQGLEKPKH